MNQAVLEERVIGIVAGVARKDPATVRRETTLVGDLAIDSASSLTLLVELEDAFGVTLSDRAAAQLRTVGDIFDYLSSVVAA